MTQTTPRARRIPRIAAGLTAGALALIGLIGIAAPAQAAAAPPVDTLADVVDPLDGLTSLREAVTLANSDAALDTITFQPGLTGTIPLSLPLTISYSLIIDATGADITVSRVNGSSFDLFVADFSVAYSSLAMTGFAISNDGLAPADVGRGLVVFNGSGNDVGDVTLTDMTFFGHDGGSPAGGGGAISIYESTNVTITRGSISSNEVNSGYLGGGLYFAGGNYGELNIDGTTFASNDATRGGAVYVDDVNGVSITGATFQLNHGTDYGGAVSITRVALDGVEIANTQFLENSVDAFDGGALYLADNVGPTAIRGSTFTDSTGARTGGAAFIYDTAAVTVEDTTFGNNSSDDSGAGAYFDLVDGPLGITRVTFDHNQSAGRAGGAYLGIISGATTISGSVFRDNSATRFGGGLYALGLSVASAITDTQFITNAANDAGGGASIGTLDADLNVARSTFRGNRAGLGAGGLDIGILDAAAELTIDSSTFAENTPTMPAGQSATALAFTNSAGDVTIISSTFSESSSAAPAIYFDTNPSSGGLSIAHSTIVSGAQGVYIRDMSTSDFDVRNSIISGTPEAVTVEASQGGVVITGYSILSTAQGPSIFDDGGNKFSTDPQLGPLASNGGTTQTRLPLAGSPAINAGNPAFTAPPAVDQRGAGFPRVQGGRIDIGATELQPVLAATGQIVSWWLFPVAGGILVVGILALVLAARRRSAGHSSR